MKKIKKNGASIFVIFCLIFASISAITTVGDPTVFSTAPFGEIVVVKEVYDDGVWTEGPVEVSIGETLQFRINITYYNTSGLPRYHYAYNIRVNDSLPDCLEYDIGTADPDTIFVWTDDPNETLYWDFGASPLFDTESFIITYNATVIEPTEPMPQENNVTVIWDEICTGGDELVSSDILIITIGLEPELNLIKRIWNNATSQWVKSLIAEEGEILRFRIDVNNDGPVDLTNVTVKDHYPAFIEPFEFYPAYTSIDTVNRIITWELGTLPAYNSSIILFNATINSTGEPVTGKNYANVTCDQQLFDEDNVTITILKRFIVDKKVRDPLTGEWVDAIEYVKKCEAVRFRINLTYYGMEVMKCLVVNDTLPEYCLNYSDNLYIEIAGVEISPGSPQYPDVFTYGDIVEMCCSESVVVPEYSIYFSWVNRTFGLGYGESVIIEFDATVIEYCEIQDPCIVQNCVEAWLWGCNCEVLYYGLDCVDITCQPIPGEFNKTVSPEVDPPQWGKEVHTVQGYSILIKLEFTYYGNENLTNVSFLDELCCVLEYESTISSPSGTIIDVSPDKKTVWWNVSRNVTDCETLIIIFKAKVVGASDCGGCINTAYFWGYIWRYCLEYDCIVKGNDTATIFAASNSPPCSPDVSGPQEGIIGSSYTFRAMLDDPDGDQLTYIFDWGDTSPDTTGGPVSPGEVTESHTFTTPGSYQIKVKATDEHGLESDWTPYPITILIKQPEIELSLKMFHISTVNADVTNTGDVDINNLNWEFEISRNATLNFRDIDIDGSGVIGSLPIGGTQIISSDPIGLKFGRATVTVTASKTGVISPKSITAQAFIVGPIVIILP